MSNTPAAPPPEMPPADLTKASESWIDSVEGPGKRAPARPPFTQDLDGIEGNSNVTSHSGDNSQGRRTVDEGQAASRPSAPSDSAFGGASFEPGTSGRSFGQERAAAARETAQGGVAPVARPDAGPAQAQEAVAPGVRASAQTAGTPPTAQQAGPETVVGASPAAQGGSDPASSGIEPAGASARVAPEGAEFAAAPQAADAEAEADQVRAEDSASTGARDGAAPDGSAATTPGDAPPEGQPDAASQGDTPPAETGAETPLTDDTPTEPAPGDTGGAETASGDPVDAGPAQPEPVAETDDSSSSTDTEVADPEPVAPPNAAPENLTLAAARPDMPLDMPQPGDTVQLDVRLAGEAYRGDPKYEIVVDGEVVARGSVDWSRETTTEGRYDLISDRDSVDFRDISIDLEVPEGGFESVEVRFPNDKYRRGVGDRNLIVDQISIDGHAVQAESTDVHYQGGKFKGDMTSERMPWRGSLEFDVTDIFSDSVPKEAPEGPYILEGQPGAAVGELSFTDSDLSDTHTLTVSDDRFEVDGTTLKLRDGVALDFETESAISVDVTVTDQAGAQDTLSVDISVVDMPEFAPPTIDVEPSFMARYFEIDHPVRTLSDIDFSADPTHVDALGEVDFERTRGSFWEGGDSDRFGAQITGQIDVPENGVYTFTMGSDDGSTLLIDGIPVIDNDRLHPFRSEDSEISLDAGPHTIEVLYFENRGHAGLKLEWEGPGIDGKQLLTPSPEGGAASGIEGEAMNFALDTSFAGGQDALTLTGLPEGALVELGGTPVFSEDGVFDLTGQSGDTLTITPPPDYQGEVEATLTATDLHGATSETPLHFDVVAPPWEPEAPAPEPVEAAPDLANLEIEEGLDALPDADPAATNDILEARIEFNNEDGVDDEIATMTMVDL